ncbi:MAG: hypothetical protein HQK75_03540 [Candidatus Magnetomorum sp.]|nr:hypothetical protein [Candidatus Magnetomorum sp.]
MKNMDFDEKIETAISEEISEEEVAFEFGDSSTEPNEHYHPDENYTLMKEYTRSRLILKRVPKNVEAECREMPKSVKFQKVIQELRCRMLRNSKIV